MGRRCRHRHWDDGGREYHPNDSSAVARRELAGERVTWENILVEYHKHNRIHIKNQTSTRCIYTPYHPIKT